MNLEDYIKRENKDIETISKELGVTEVSIRRYISGERRPEERIMVDIFNWSNGEVTPNDFYNITLEE